MNTQLLSPADSLINRIRNFWIDHPVETGITLIDLQHIYFLYILIDLHDLTSGLTEFSGERAQKAFSRIIEYASEHFYAEEVILKRLHFPDYESHIDSHRNFIDYLKHKTHARIASDPAYANEIAMYLVTWLFNHIMKEDILYVRHYSQKENLLENLGRSLVAHGEIFVSEFQMNLYSKVSGQESNLQVCDENIINTIHHLWHSFDLSLHIPLLDMQHLWFIQILLQMDRETRLSTNEARKKVLDESMLRIEDYARVHFSTEEKLMENFTYPGLKTHRHQHHIFSNSMKTRTIEIQEHGADLAMFMDSTRRMKDWLLSHIAVQDKSLLWFLKKNRKEVLQISKQLIRSGEAGLKRKQITLYRRISDPGVRERLADRL